MNVCYSLESIDHISYGKMGKLEAESYAGNGFKKNDACIKIFFKNGQESTFGDCWTVVFD